jgi:membrane protease subunit HflK
MRYLLYLVVFVFLIWTVGTSLTQVQSHERGVVRRFGRILEQKPQQGLYIGLPWGIDRVDLVPVGRERTITVGFTEDRTEEEETMPVGQMLTGDHNLVNVEASINFKVREESPEKFVLQADNIDAFVARAAESLLAEWVGGRTVHDVIRHGKHELPEYLRRELGNRLDAYDLGIDIGQVSITNRFGPPLQVKEAFDRLAEAQTSIATKMSIAGEKTNRKWDEASSKLFAMERNARAYAKNEVNKANAEADSFRRRLAQYRELSRTNPDYLNALWLDGMKRLYGRMRDEGRVELLDQYLTNGELSITQFPLQPRKK